MGLETCFAWLAKKFGEAKMTKKREQSKRFYSTFAGKKRPERPKTYSPGHRPGDKIAKSERFHYLLPRLSNAFVYRISTTQKHLSIVLDYEKKKCLIESGKTKEFGILDKTTLLPRTCELTRSIV